VVSVDDRSQSGAVNIIVLDKPPARTTFFQYLIPEDIELAQHPGILFQAGGGNKAPLYRAAPLVTDDKRFFRSDLCLAYRAVSIVILSLAYSAFEII
jgi:hypothetical protein